MSKPGLRRRDDSHPGWSFCSLILVRVQWALPERSDPPSIPRENPQVGLPTAEKGLSGYGRNWSLKKCLSRGKFTVECFFMKSSATQNLAVGPQGSAASGSILVSASNMSSPENFPK